MYRLHGFCQSGNTCRLDNAFGIVDRHLQKQAFTAGASPTIADISSCGDLFYPVEESGYEASTRFAHIGTWLQRVRAIPGWADPCHILRGERLAPKW